MSRKKDSEIRWLFLATSAACKVVEAIDCGLDGTVLPPPGAGEVDGHLGPDVTGVGPEDQNPVGEQDGLLDVVGDGENGAGRDGPGEPQVEKLSPEALRREDVEGREGLVHEEDVGLDRESARNAHALPHPAGQLARIGGFEAVEADEVDQPERLVAAHLGRHALRLEPELDVAQDIEPGQERERLEDHGHAGTRPAHCVPAIAHLARAGRDQPGEDPEEAGLPGSRLAEEGDDLALVKRQVHVLEDGVLGVAGREGKALRHAPALEQGQAPHAFRPQLTSGGATAAPPRRPRPLTRCGISSRAFSATRGRGAASRFRSDSLFISPRLRIRLLLRTPPTGHPQNARAIRSRPFTPV
jgi:hypothetical protein